MCGLLEPISRPFFKGREGAEIRLSGRGEEEVVALIDEIEDALNGLWSVAHRGEWVYAEARMTSLLEVLGTAFQGYIQKKLRARDLWRAGFKGVEDALQVGIQILHRWNQMVALLTKLEWIGGNHAHVYGGAYDTAALDAFRGRLEEILSIRLAHEAMKRLLSEQELTALLAGDAFQPFDQINSLLVSKFQEPLWKAAKDEYGRRMGSTEARTSQKLKETLSGVILPAMSAAVAEYASAGTGAVAQPYQAFQQLDRYTKLLENPNVARALQAEIDAVLRCFEGYLDGVRTDFERRAHQGPGRGGGSGASIVQEMEWVIQADRKVTHTMKLFRGLRDSRTGGGLQGLCDDLTKDMRAHKGALFQRWQARTEESLHEIRIEKRGKLMDLDSQHGHIKLHYNDELVALLKEVRQLAATVFCAPGGAGYDALRKSRREILELGEEEAAPGKEDESEMALAELRERVLLLKSMTPRLNPVNYGALATKIEEVSDALCRGSDEFDVEYYRRARAAGACDYETYNMPKTPFSALREWEQSSMVDEKRRHGEASISTVVRRTSAKVPPLPSTGARYCR